MSQGGFALIRAETVVHDLGACVSYTQCPACESAHHEIQFLGSVKAAPGSK